MLPCSLQGVKDRLLQLWILQFCFVALAEFGPALLIVMEPFSKLRAWRDILHPGVEAHIGFLFSTRPQAINENTVIIRGDGLFVGPFEQNLHLSCPVLSLQLRELRRS